MTDLSMISRPIAEELGCFETFFGQEMSAQSQPLAAILAHVKSRNGKQLRPMLVLLCAKMLGEVNETTYRAATFVEMLHTATLIHDDVVAESDSRRGLASVNAEWDNQTAVLAGDYLLAKAMLLMARPDTYNLLNEMLRTAASMSEGELVQNQKRGEKLCEADYLDIITRKTAVLLRACCVAGAMSVGTDEPTLQRVSDFGLHLGIVFQMRDDILDDESPECVAYAKALIDHHLEMALSHLDALPVSVCRDALRELTVFCAKREQ